MFEKDLLNTKSFEELWSLIKALPKNCTDIDLLLKIAFTDLGSFKEQKFSMKRNKAIFDIQNKDDASELRSLTRTMGAKMELKQFETFSRMITSKYFSLKGTSELTLPFDFTEEDEELSAPSPIVREFATPVDSLSLSSFDDTPFGASTFNTTTTVVQNYPRLEKMDVSEAANKALSTSSLLISSNEAMNSLFPVDEYGLCDYSREIQTMIKGIQAPGIQTTVSACLKYWDVIFAAVVIFKGSRLRKIQICFENFDINTKLSKLNFSQIKILLCYFIKWVERMSDSAIWKENIQIKSDNLENLKKVKEILEKKGRIGFAEFRFKIIPMFPTLEEWMMKGHKLAREQLIEDQRRHSVASFGDTSNNSNNLNNLSKSGVRELPKKKTAKEILEEENKRKTQEEKEGKGEEKKKEWNFVRSPDRTKSLRTNGVGSGEFRLSGTRNQKQPIDEDWVVLPNSNQSED